MKSRPSLYYRLQRYKYEQVLGIVTRSFLPLLKRGNPWLLGASLGIETALQIRTSVNYRSNFPNLMRGWTDVTSQIDCIFPTAQSFLDLASEVYGEGSKGIFVPGLGECSYIFGKILGEDFVVFISEDSWFAGKFSIHVQDVQKFMTSLEKAMWANEPYLHISFNEMCTSGIKKVVVRRFAEDAPRGVVSRLAGDLGDRIQKLTDNYKIPRKMILVGSPGVGKSTVLRHLLDGLPSRLRILRIRAAKWSEIASSIPIIFNLHPNVVVIDDLDHLDPTGSSALFFFEKVDALVLCTANSLDKFPAALLRPGRIDEIVEVTPHDLQDVKEVLLKCFPVGCVASLKDLPLAFIHEICTRVGNNPTEETVLKEAALVRKVLEKNPKVSVQPSKEEPPPTKGVAKD